jgi:hypothetical protein
MLNETKRANRMKENCKCVFCEFLQRSFFYGKLLNLVNLVY